MPESSVAPSDFNPDFVEWAEAAVQRWASDQPEYVAVDTETTGVAFFDTPFCVTIAWNDAAGGTVPVEGHYFELGFDKRIEAALIKLLSATPNLVFHNAKFDLQKLALVGLLDSNVLDPHTVWDTECLAHLLDEHRVKRLKVLAKDILGEETDEDEVLKVARRKNKLRKEDGYDLLPREVVIPYAIKDAEFTIRLLHNLKPQLDKIPDLVSLNRMEQELTFTLLGMETRGMGIDLEYVETTAKEYGKRALVQEMLIRDMTGDEEFNPNSPKQIMEAFAAMGMELDGTDKLTLRKAEHPLASAILELRSVKKMHGTYLKPMLAEQRDGILHPSFRQHGTKTGRMSSGGAEHD